LAQTAFFNTNRLFAVSKLSAKNASQNSTSTPIQAQASLYFCNEAFKIISARSLASARKLILVHNLQIPKTGIYLFFLNAPAMDYCPIRNVYFYIKYYIRKLKLTYN
jgi:hypothetical protein